MSSQLHRLLSDVRTLLAGSAPCPESDAALLRGFIRDRSETAFAALVERYGDLVFRVCRRVLADATAAEDCVQATFMILARKAETIGRPDRLSAWLHGTARKLAHRQRRGELRRVQRELRRGEFPRGHPQQDPLEELTARELLAILDEELDRLPEVYRLPLLLCGVEGYSQEQAAVQLGWTAGSIKGRLERGRARLQDRLRQRGLGLSAILGAAELVRGVAPTELLRTAVQSALAFRCGGAVLPISPGAIVLARGGLQAMAIGKWKWLLTGLVMTGLLGSGLGWLVKGTGNPVPDLVGSPPALAAGPAPKTVALADREVDEQRKRREEMLERLKLQLIRGQREAEREEEMLSDKVITVRQKMVEIEERLRVLDANERAESMSGAEVKAREAVEAIERSLNDLDEKIASAKARLVAGAKSAPIEELTRQKRDLSTRKEMAVAELSRIRQTQAKLRAEVSDLRIALRKELILLEESVRRLEQKRATHRAEFERDREDTLERIRRLAHEGEAAAPDPDARRWEAIERRLRILQGELAELSREVRRLRTEPKK